MKTYEELQAENAALVAERDVLATGGGIIMELTAWKIDSACVAAWKEIEDLKRQNAALAAQVVRMVTLLSSVRGGEEFIVDHAVIIGVDSDLADEIDEVISSTPEQCLNEIHAKAGLAGYVEGFKRRDKLGPLRKVWSIQEIVELADEYAERVKLGEQ